MNGCGSSSMARVQREKKLDLQRFGNINKPLASMSTGWPTGVGSCSTTSFRSLSFFPWEKWIVCVCLKNHVSLELDLKMCLFPD